MEQATNRRWRSNESLPGNYQWGYASRSRHRAMAGPVVEHVIVDATGTDVGTYGSMLCSAGWGIVGAGGGRRCPSCVALVRDQLSDE